LKLQLLVFALHLSGTIEKYALGAGNFDHPSQDLIYEKLRLSGNFYSKLHVRLDPCILKGEPESAWCCLRLLCTHLNFLLSFA
jgi:hypothetical protein